MTGTRQESVPPLLRTLSMLSPVSAGWKNVDQVLNGVGDVDWIAPRTTWPEIIAAVTDWARATDLGPVIACRHWPDALFVIALDDDREFFQLDVRSRVTFRGATLFRPADVKPLLTLDSRGFRRMRPGAEGVLRLILKGVGPGGRPNPAVSSDSLLQLMETDPAGVEGAAALFRPLSGPVVTAAFGLQRRHWSRPAMLAVQGLFSLKAAAEPTVALRRLHFRAYARARCPVLRASIDGRRHPPPDQAAWLRDVARKHEIIDPSAARPGSAQDGPGAGAVDARVAP